MYGPLALLIHSWSLRVFKYLYEYLHIVLYGPLKAFRQR